MLDVSKFIIQILQSTIYIYIIYQLLNYKVTFKTAIIAGSILAVFWKYSYLVGDGVIQNLLVYNMLIVLIIYIATHINILKVLIAVFVYLNVSNMIEYSSLALITIILDIPIQSHTESFIYVMIYSISFIINGVFYLMLKKYNIHLFDSSQKYFPVERMFSRNSKKFTRIKDVFNDYIIITLVVVLQMTLVTDYFYSIEYFELSAKIELRTFILCITLLFLNIMTLFLVKKVQKARDDIHHSKIKEIEFSQIEKENQIIRQYKHDLHNQFSLLCGLAEKNRYEEVYRHLVNYREDISNKIITIDTGLEELDILLYSKINKAQQNDIEISYTCYTSIYCNEKHIFDFVSIISNLLDNAIEASQKCETKLIKIYIDEEVLDYIFTIENTYADKAVLSPDVILQEGFSTKGSGRGFGLKIIDRLVRKYDGSIEFKNTEDLFIVKVALPIHELERY